MFWCIRYEAECMVKGEHTFLLLALLYESGLSSAGDESDVFKVQYRLFVFGIIKFLVYCEVRLTLGSVDLDSLNLFINDISLYSTGLLWVM